MQFTLGSNTLGKIFETVLINIRYHLVTQTLLEEECLLTILFALESNICNPDWLEYIIPELMLSYVSDT